MVKKIIYTLFLFGVYISSVNGLEINRLNYYLDTNYTFNITGKIDDNKTIETSYSGSNLLPEYYNTYIKINNSEKIISNIINGSKYQIKEDIYITHSFIYSNNNKSIELEYELENATKSEVALKLATISDIDFTSSDNISLYKTNNNIFLTDDNKKSNSYGLQFVVGFINKPNTIWIGSYNKLLENKYNNSSDIYFHNIDSGMVWSYDIVIPSNSKVSKKVNFHLKESSLKSINIHKINGNIITEKLLYGSSYTLEKTNYIYNTMEDGTGKTYSSYDKVIINDDIIDIYEININPKTNDNIYIYILILVSSILSLLLLKMFKTA